MKIKNNLAEQAALMEIGDRLANCRVEESLTQAELANRAGIGKRTLERLEKGGSVQTESLVRVLRELKLLENLDTLLPEVSVRPIDLAKLQGKARQRVRNIKSPQPSGTSWVWGEDEHNTV